MQFARKKRRSPALNIIPLIDVLVVLLIFYIATTVFKKTQHNISIVVPSSSHASVAQDATPSTIYVTKDSKISFDDTDTSPDKLGDLLKAKKATNPDVKIYLKSDEGAPFGMIVKVMDAARDAGITDLQTYATPPAEGDATGGAATP